MSQSQWDYLEKNKQDIIEGKLACKIWNFDVLKGINDTLTEEEMKTVFSYFSWADQTLLDGAYENLKIIVDDVISFRSKATVYGGFRTIY